MKTIHIDAPPVTSDEATELCCYHLRMAAAYYEATEDDGALTSEMQRVCKSGTPDADMRALLPFHHWLTTISDYYERLKQHDL